jgi:hypothetical protein
MDKEHILCEIKRTAEENGDKPLGSARFQAATGIRESDWFGKYWKSWGDALREAGFRPNEMQAPYDEEVLIKALIDLTRELGRFPVKGDLLLKRRQDASFPSHNVFRRFGSKQHCVSKIVEYCRAHQGCHDVAATLAGVSAGKIRERSETASAKEVFGFVYLLKSGRHYKIGHTNAVGRRERELAIQLPDEARRVHVIQTDDPPGIEAYWQKRFADKRKHGEWFELDSRDVAAFRRRRFM